MALVQRFNVEGLFGTAPLYLSHIPGIGMRWSTDAEEAFEYDDRDEAEADAEANGGEVFQFTRLMRRTDVESFTGHNAAARIERALNFIKRPSLEGLMSLVPDYQEAAE